jgi:hypothetical protein
MEPNNKRGNTLFVVPRGGNAAILQQELPEGDRAIHPGAALCGARFDNAIVMPLTQSFDPHKYYPESYGYEEWLDETVRCRLKPGGKII